MMRRSFSLLLSLTVITMCLLERQGIAAPSGDSLTQDEAAIARHIAELNSSNVSVHEAAAAALRAIVAKYPSGTSDIRDKDAGRAAWQKKIEQTGPGMTEADVEKILPPAKGSSEKMSVGSGDSHNEVYRLDDHWLVSLAYRNSGGLLGTPDLRQSEQRAGFPWSPHFTGRWTSWFVNGQKAEEVVLRDGKYDGILTCFWNNGGKCFEQHYVSGTCEGADTGWYPGGKLNYTAHYKHGQQDGIKTHWYENGKKQTEAGYKDGKNDGLEAEWYENGQMQFEKNYRDGVENGLNAAWNEKGEVEYSHQMKDGNVVE